MGHAGAVAQECALVEEAGGQCEDAGMTAVVGQEGGGVCTSGFGLSLVVVVQSL